MTILDDISIPQEINEVCIDVGLAADAPHTISWLSQNPNCFVFGFEPVKENCERVLEKIKSLGFENRFRLFQCAVDDVQGEQIKNFHVTCNSEVKGDHGQSSLYKLRDELKNFMWVEKTVPTVCVNLKDFLNKIDWNRFSKITVLKTDTQGNDLTILKSIHQYLDKIQYIQCESHVHNQYQKEEDNPQHIYDYLTSNGYKMLGGDIQNPDHTYQRVGI